MALQDVGGRPGPGDLIGYRRSGQPIYLYAGGAETVTAEDDDEGLDGTEPDDADEDEEGDDTGDESDRGQSRWQPPSEEEWNRLRDAQKRNNGELKNSRLIRKLMSEQGLTVEALREMLETRDHPDDGAESEDGQDEDQTPDDQPPAQPAGPSKADQAAINKAVRTAVRDRDREHAAKLEKYRGALAQTAILAELKTAGWNGNDLARVLRVVDLDAVELGEDGAVVGADEQVADVKAEFPEWFRKRRAPTVRDAQDVDGESKSPPPAKNPTWAGEIVKRWESGR